MREREEKHVTKYIYEGLGFPVALENISLILKRGIWTPAVDYNQLQAKVLLTLSQKPDPLTGNEVHFIRTYLEMTLTVFSKKLKKNVSDVLGWEKSGNDSAKIDPSTELSMRKLILDKLNIEKV